jgi:ferritin
LRHKKEKEMNKIPEKVLAELTRQFNLELSASHNYRALSLWCDDQNLKGFARYFAKQSAEELTHAAKMTGHLIDRGVLPELAAIPAPKCVFKSLLEAAQHAQTLESNNTKGINAVYEAAIAAKDYAAQTFMQWFISEQVEEEAWCLEMVERVQSATCAGGLSDLDRHIERYLEGDKS